MFKGIHDKHNCLDRPPSHSGSNYALLASPLKGGKILDSSPFKGEAKRGIGLCDGVELMASSKVRRRFSAHSRVALPPA